MKMYKIKCYGNCGNIIYSSAPAQSVPKWTREAEFTCSRCEEKMWLASAEIGEPINR